MLSLSLVADVAFLLISLLIPDSIANRVTEGDYIQDLKPAIRRPIKQVSKCDSTSRKYHNERVTKAYECIE